jgi:hypothetical protein
MGTVESFVLGVIITIVVAVIAPLTTGPIQRWWAARSKKQANHTIKSLESSYSLVRTYHDEPQKLLRFVGMRILLLTILWIGQSLLDVLFGFVINGVNVAGSEFSYAIFPVDTSTISSWLSAAASLIDAIILGLLFRTGIHSYRIAKNAADFERYKAKIENEIATIRDQSGLSESAQQSSGNVDLAEQPRDGLPGGGPDEPRISGRSVSILSDTDQQR